MLKNERKYVQRIQIMLALMSDKIANIKREMETIKNNQVAILELRSAVEIKNSL